MAIIQQTPENQINQNLIQEIMSNPNYSLIRYQADNIPCFDGNSKQISRFIRSCEHFLTNHQDTTNNEAKINVCLFDTIIGKLTGRAADLVGSRMELNSWLLIKNALINTFSDQRSEDCLVQDIISMRLEKNEPIQNFGLRIQDSRSLLFTKINNTNLEAQIKLLKIHQYDDLCLKTFINNLNYHMQLVVRLKSPGSLEQAMSFVREEENFINYKNRSNFNNRNMPTQAQKQNKPFQQQTYNNSQAHYSNNMPQPLFRPQQNFTPNFNPNFRPNMPFQRQNFGNQFQPNFQRSNIMQPNRFTPRNTFTPMTRPFFNNNNTGAIPRNNTQKPEPMDTSSGNTRMNSVQRSNHFSRTQPQKNWESHELFNQSVNQNQIDDDTSNLNQEPPQDNTEYYPDLFDTPYHDQFFENNQYSQQTNQYFSEQENNHENNYNEYDCDGNFHIPPKTDDPT